MGWAVRIPAATRPTAHTSAELSSSKGAFRKVAVTNPVEFDPRKFLIPAMDAVTELCRLRYEQFGSAGMAGRIDPMSLSDMATRYANGSLDQRVTTG